ncbi:DEAD/DEAH box helicase [Georgenia faecalis]|uniref:RNA helicase n=1 Tax=Georgenia faecalis TaxID=2483799 RepID=A0ABV9DAG1_9MICO|nr:DEAD/DEAH box helicase [Georgenia faecalis]
MPSHASADLSGADFSELDITVPTTFADLGLPEHLLSAVLDLGFTIPTDIQAEAIPRLLSGRDVVGIAQTGTGKTAAFGLPLLAAVDANRASVQALVLAPTRELAVQVSDAIASFAARTPKLRVLPIYGGSSFTPQLRGLREGAQVVVGTPGRIIDLMERGTLDLSGVRFLVLDEADEMLRMGFADDVEKIAANVPASRRTALFSATMPAAIKKVAATHLTDPVRVAVSRPSSTTATVHQTFAVVPFRHKIGALARVLAVSDADAAIVFVRTKSAAEEVALELAGRGIQAAAISGDVAQREREKLIDRLRSGTLDVLVATDVAARGLDVERIGLVVNFDVPREAEGYVHRIGRTGRAGRSGEALTFLTPRERGRLSQIERLTGTALEEIRIPSPADVSAHKANVMLADVEARHAAGRLDLYRELIAVHEAQHGMDVYELAATLLAMAIGDGGPGTDVVEAPTTESSEFVQARFDSGSDREHVAGRGRSGGARSAGTGPRYRVEVGHRDGVQPGAIVGAITGEGGLRGSDLGKIDIFPSFSLVEINAELDAEASRRIGAARVAGRPLRIRPDAGPRRPQRDGGRPEGRTEHRGGGHRSAH